MSPVSFYLILIIPYFITLMLVGFHCTWNIESVSERYLRDVTVKVRCVQHVSIMLNRGFQKKPLDQVKLTVGHCM